jgi:hypothetical protein
MHTNSRAAIINTVSDCCYEHGYHHRVSELQDAIICSIWPRDRKENDGCINVVVSGFEARKMQGLEDLARQRFNSARKELEQYLAKETTCN